MNRLSESGEVSRRIRCLAGRVTVFRSQADEELQAYQYALEGRPQRDRFSILLDGAAFRPQDHAFIGYRERYTGDGTITAYEFLTRRGVASEAVEPKLLAYGLGGLSTARFADLQDWQIKVLRILGETTAAQRIICLHEPFEGIPDRWREPVAELLTSYAWSKKMIVVVTKLSYRPECWIENDHIARVQLERPRSRTIGFGGGEFSSPESIDALRKEMGLTEGAPKVQSTKGGVDLVGAPTRSSAPPRSHLREMLSLGGVAVLLILAAAGYLAFRAVPPERVASLNVTADKPVAKRAEAATSGGVEVAASGSASTVVVGAPAPKDASFADLAPEVREAWLAAFNQPMKLPDNPPAEVVREEVAAPWSDPSEEGPSVTRLYDALQASP